MPTLVAEGVVLNTCGGCLKWGILSYNGTNFVLGLYVFKKLFAH